MPSREEKKIAKEDRGASKAFFGCGEGGRHFDEPEDPTVAVSAITTDEWREMQMNQFSEPTTQEVD